MSIGLSRTEQKGSVYVWGRNDEGVLGTANLANKVDEMEDP